MSSLTHPDPDRQLISGLRERLDRAGAAAHTAAEDAALEASIERLRHVAPPVERRGWFRRRARR
jgi:hypothetical protein